MRISTKMWAKYVWAGGSHRGGKWLGSECGTSMGGLSVEASHPYLMCLRSWWICGFGCLSQGSDMKKLILAAALISGSTAAAQSQSGVVQSGPQPSASDVQGYWTPQRMKTA